MGTPSYYDAPVGERQVRRTLALSGRGEQREPRSGAARCSAMPLDRFGHRGATSSRPSVPGVHGQDAASLDDLIGLQKQWLRDRQAERLRGV